jgi:dTDP-4-dehydrorhamnose reductase
MRIVILGGAGMLGHKLAQTLAQRHETLVTFRDTEPFDTGDIFHRSQVRYGIDATTFSSVHSLLSAFRPDAVINCIGVVKQAIGPDSTAVIELNALFPHYLAKTCEELNIRLLHISTDCVFSGIRGHYDESDQPDPYDVYGMSKLLGEPQSPISLTIRTSIIGRELRTRHGLLEWFLAQTGGHVRGYKNAIFSGFTTCTLADIIADVLSTHQNLNGVWHISADPISKFDLLCLIRQIYAVDIDVLSDTTFRCDRSLNSERFRRATSYVPPSWAQMIQAMHDDPTMYRSTTAGYEDRG